MAGDVTRLIRDWRSGENEALDQLIPLVYEELRALADDRLRGERPGHTLQATALVHEAYARLVVADIDFNDRAHFFAVIAQTMRRILVDYARSRARAKRGGKQVPMTLDDQIASVEERPEELLALDEALNRLAEVDPRKAKVVELHYFGGLTYADIAAALEISDATVFRDLRLAKAWLATELGPETTVNETESPDAGTTG